MTRARVALLLLVLSLILWVLFVRGERPRRAPNRDRTAPEEPRTAEPEPAAAHPTALAGAIGRLGDALADPDSAFAAQDAAAALRACLRTDASARAEAERMLLDEATDPTLRQVLALVLGTLAGGPSDATLLAALARFPDDAAFVRCLLLALGATRDPPDEDEIFGLGKDPWGAMGPGGIGITVRRAIADPRVRAALAGHLARPEAAVREAAATSLRHSLAEPDARSAFVATLAAEPTDDVATVLGEALAQWAGTTGDAVEREAVLGRLLARAGEAGLDGYRLKLEDDFRRVAIGPAQRATLLDLAAPSRGLAVRSFALTLLAGSAVASGADAVGAARRCVIDVVESDESIPLRDLGARLLGELPTEAGAIATLLRAAREDPAWNVRWQALGSLARLESGAPLRAALEGATRDPDARVQARARELLARAR